MDNLGAFELCSGILVGLAHIAPPEGRMPASVEACSGGIPGEPIFDQEYLDDFATPTLSPSASSSES